MVIFFNMVVRDLTCDNFYDDDNYCRVQVVMTFDFDMQNQCDNYDATTDDCNCCATCFVQQATVVDYTMDL